MVHWYECEPGIFFKKFEIVEDGMPRGTETILIVDDEQEVLRTLKPMLESLGYRVLTADSASEAIKTAKEHTETIHLLVTDVEMPVVSGAVLAKSLRLINPGLKCLFMSGYTSRGVAFFGMLENGEEFIHKPFSMRDLAAKIRTLLDFYLGAQGSRSSK